MSEGRSTPTSPLDVSSALGAVPQDSSAGRRQSTAWNTAESRFFAAADTNANPSCALLLPPPSGELVTLRRRSGATRWIVAGAIALVGGGAALAMRGRSEAPVVAHVAEPVPVAAPAEPVAAAPIAQPDVPARELRELPPGPPELATADSTPKVAALAKATITKHAKAKRATKRHAKKHVAARGKHARAKKPIKRRT